MHRLPSLEHSDVVEHWRVKCTFVSLPYPICFGVTVFYALHCETSEQPILSLACKYTCNRIRVHIQIHVIIYIYIYVPISSNYLYPLP